MNNYILGYFIFFICMYIISTFSEYFLHKYIMHNPNNSVGKRHITHHKSTNKDMTLNTNDEDYKIILPSENLFLDDWLTILMIFSISCITVYSFYKYYPTELNLKILLLISSLFALFEILIWNSVHSYMHGRDGYEMGYFSLKQNITSYLVENFSYFKWIINNHIKHHNVKGDKKGNFNIVFPGADFLLNTYN